MNDKIRELAEKLSEFDGYKLKDLIGECEQAYISDLIGRCKSLPIFLLTVALNSVD